MNGIIIWILLYLISIPLSYFFVQEASEKPKKDSKKMATIMSLIPILNFGISFIGIVICGAFSAIGLSKFLSDLNNEN